MQNVITLHVKLHRTDATLLMGEGWGGVGHVTLRVKLHRTHGRTCVQHFLAALRVLESTAGKNFRQRCPLCGSVEVDGSFIGKFHMSANDLRHADQIQQD